MIRPRGPKYYAAMTWSPEPELDVAAYARRIGYDGPLEPTLDILRAMQLAHFYHVPFENLDIHTGHRIEVDARVNFEKIVNRGRGGFCLELSGLFARVLRQIGFQVDVLGGRVLNSGRLGMPLSHMTLLVHLDEPYLADVGFGGSIAAPLRLLDRDPQHHEGRKYIIDHDGDHWLLSLWDVDGRQATYVFTLQPRDFREFDAVCHWLQTSPESIFTSGPFASRAAPGGRITLTAGKFIETQGENRSERMVESRDEQFALFRDRFGIVVPVTS